MLGADNVTDCQLCPLGTFSEATGAISEATCSKCEKGKYANKTGTASELQCYRCPMVSFCSLSGTSILLKQSMLQVPDGEFFLLLGVQKESH